MMTANKDASERQDIEALLPWHAAGTLGRRDAQRVEEALTNDPDLARHFEVVREELAETIHLNETLGAPSARAMEKLFAAIDAESASASPRRAPASLSERLAEFLVSFSPRTLAWSAAAAAFVILAQAAVIGGVLLTDRTAHQGYQTASYGESAPVAAGSFALVRFAPQANVAEITRFLGDHNASLVDGPKAGGLYRVRLSESRLSKDDLGRLVAEMQQDKVVGFIAPTE